jgi:archaellum component FlaC
MIDNVTMTKELYEELATQSKRYKWFMEQLVDCYGSYFEYDLSSFDDSLDGIKKFLAHIDKEVEGIL